MAKKKLNSVDNPLKESNIVSRETSYGKKTFFCAFRNEKKPNFYETIALNYVSSVGAAKVAASVRCHRLYRNERGFIVLGTNIDSNSRINRVIAIRHPEYGWREFIGDDYNGIEHTVSE